MEQRRPRLEGKVAIVTGADSSGPGVGTGKATAILFAREGARVMLVDRAANRAEETLGTIRDEGGEASVFEADITRAADCQAMAAAMFLASDEARWITGIVLPVDAGLLATTPLSMLPYLRQV